MESICEKRMREAEAYYISQGVRAEFAVGLARLGYPSELIWAEKILRGISSDVSLRDEAVLSCVYISSQMDSGESRRDYRMTQDMTFCYAVEKLRSKIKRRGGYLQEDKVAKEILDKKYSKKKFQLYSDMLVAFKLADSQPNALQKRYGAAVLGNVGMHFSEKKSRGKRKKAPRVEQIVPTLSIEDYWGYEQRIGVNLCVEVCALLDELFELGEKRYNNFLAIKNQIFDTVVQCILDNYKEIAWIPAIDYKISIIKVAVSVVVKLFFDALKLEKQAKITNGKGEKAGIELNSTDGNPIPKLIALSRDALVYLKVGEAKETLTNQRLLVEKVLGNIISDCFRSVLWSQLGGCPICTERNYFDLIDYWFGFERARELAVLFPEKINLKRYGYGERVRGAPIKDEKQETKKEKNVQWEQQCEEKLKEYREGAEGSLYMISEQGNLLVFCDADTNNYAKKYVRAANGKQLLSRECEARFIKVQKAIIDSMIVSE